MKGLQVHAGYLHEAVSNEVNPPTGFEAMEGEQAVGGGEETEIWLQREQEDLLDAADASIFYGDFSPLPDFPCMSASSSSSSTPAPVKAITSSSSSSSSASSSAASWAVLKSETEEDVERKRGNHNQHVALHNYEHDNSQQDPVDGSAAALSSTGSMEIPQPSDHQEMDVIETFGYMDLLESNDLFDPSIFHSDVNLLEDFAPEQRPQEQPPPLGNEEMMQRKNDGTQQGGAGTGGGASDDLAEVFLEWLKSNKETVSAEDLRRVKLKKATIECAAKRLGGGKEAMKQLLKLILEWVQTNHLQRRRMRESSSNCLPYQYQEPLQNPNPNSCPIPNPNLDYNTVQPDQSNPCFNQNPWMAPVPYVPDPAAVMPGYPPIVGYMGDPFVNGASNVNGSPYPTPPDYQMLDSAHSWSASQFALPSLYSSFAENNLQSAPIHNPAFSGYGNQYPPYQFLTAHGDSRLARLGSSATKEARKKRMARQRRFLSHHRNHNHQSNQSQNSHQSAEPHARLGNDYANPTGQGNPGNWGYWSTSASGAVSVNTPGVPTDSPPVNNVDRHGMQGQNYQRQLAASDRRQGWKPEKNLRFLLQKVLKQSDVGNLGRIVLPKKEAETHLPELEARDGISIAMEDIGTSRVWNMRYRFWPNNKSRMYLLENTGDFVRTNGLQEGDFIVIYSDVKCGKYMIRGVKVRQPAGAKSEIKRAGKSQKSSHANSPSAVNGSPSTPNTPNQTVK